jgi:hypothetical protein
MSLRSAAVTAKAISAITFAVESTGRILGKGGRTFYRALRQQQYYTIDVVMESSGEITDSRSNQTTEDIKSFLNSLEHFKGVQLLIKKQDV